MCAKSHDHEWIYRAFITLRNGRRLFAHEVGLTAFRFCISKS